jgi:hypothetical protein
LTTESVRNKLGAIRFTLESVRLVETKREVFSLPAQNPSGRLARVNVYIARELLAQGEYEQAVTACERAIAMARILDDYGLEVIATNFMGKLLLLLGQLS